MVGASVGSSRTLDQAEPAPGNILSRPSIPPAVVRRVAKASIPVVTQLRIARYHLDRA